MASMKLWRAWDWASMGLGEHGVVGVASATISYFSLFLMILLISTVNLLLQKPIYLISHSILSNNSYILPIRLLGQSTASFCLAFAKI